MDGYPAPVLVALRDYPSLDSLPHSDWARPTLVLEALKAWPQLFEADDNVAIVPLKLLPGVARDRVLEDLLQQLKGLHAALRTG